MVKPTVSVGDKFSRLTIVELVAHDKGRRLWRCVCDCGKEITTHAYNLKSGNTKSCGCLRAELSRKKLFKHGLKRTTEYRIWSNIIDRCTNPKIPGYKHYGGRGITLCPQWRADFMVFLKDVGHRPSKGHSLDRINNDGNYEPGNIRWATRHAQSINKRTNKRITFNGRTLTLCEWAKETRLPCGTILSRMRIGWSVEKTLSTPRQGRGHNRGQKKIGTNALHAPKSEATA